VGRCRQRQIRNMWIGLHRHRLGEEGKRVKHLHLTPPFRDIPGSSQRPPQVASRCPPLWVILNAPTPNGRILLLRKPWNTRLLVTRGAANYISCASAVVRSLVRYICERVLDIFAAATPRPCRHQAGTLAGVAVSAPHAGPSHRVSALCESSGNTVNYSRVGCGCCGCGHRRGPETRTITNPGRTTPLASAHGRVTPDRSSLGAEWTRTRGRSDAAAARRPRNDRAPSAPAGSLRCGAQSKCADRRYAPGTTWQHCVNCNHSTEGTGLTTWLLD
jgi:hypothetical protein